MIDDNALARLEALSVNPPYRWSEDCAEWIEEMWQGVRPVLAELRAHRLAASRRAWRRVPSPVTAEWLRAEVESAEAAGCSLWGQLDGGSVVVDIRPQQMRGLGDPERFVVVRGLRERGDDPEPWCEPLTAITATCWRDAPPTPPTETTDEETRA